MPLKRVSNDQAIARLKRTRANLIEYLMNKADTCDWHGVADAANDLREIEVEIRIRQEAS